MAHLSFQDELNRFLAGLWSIQAVTVNFENPVTWSSGIKAPVYIDLRKVLGDVRLRGIILDLLESTVTQECHQMGIDPELIAAVATAAIPYGVLLADRLELPFAYVRPRAKEHGLKRQIEGAEVKAKRIILLEELVSTGRSMMSAYRVLREAGGRVMYAVSIVSYAFDWFLKEVSREGLQYFYIASFLDIVKVGEQAGYINPESVKKVLAWYRSINSLADVSC